MAVVVAIIAAMAAMVVVTLGGVQDEAERGVAKAELRAIRDGVLRFHDDTGYLPRTGRFALVGDDSGLGVIDPSAPEHWPDAMASWSAADRAAWFAAQANLYQLLEPRDDPGNVLKRAGSLDRMVSPEDPSLTWNAQTGRGYRGPYVTGSVVDRYVDDDGLVQPGLPMPMLLDPWGQPYLLFVDPPLTREHLGPRIISAGPDRMLSSDATAIGGDDLAVFLFD